MSKIFGVVCPKNAFAYHTDRFYLDCMFFIIKNNEVPKTAHVHCLHKI